MAVQKKNQIQKGVLKIKGVIKYNYFFSDAEC